MKRNLVVWVVLVVMAVFCGRSALADLNQNLSNNINLGDLNFGYSVYSGSGPTSFNANLSTKDTVTDSYVSISRDSTTSDEGWVFADFYGTLTMPASLVDYQSQNLSVNHQGVSYNLGSSIGAYQDTVWSSDSSYVLGDIWSTTNVYASIAGVTPLYANGNYSEYYSGGMGKGIAPADTIGKNDSFSASVQWRVRFDDPVVGNSIEASSPGVGVSSPATVPEPASLSIVGFASAALLLHRRRSCR